jgi:hypothetical protein
MLQCSDFIFSQNFPSLLGLKSNVPLVNSNRKTLIAKEKTCSITTYSHEIKTRRPTKAGTVSHWSYLPPVTRETFMQQLILIFLGLYNRRINRIQGNQVIGREH